MNIRNPVRKPAQAPATLLDRVAIGAFSGLCALGLGSVIWFMLTSFLWRLTSLPFQPVLYGSLVVAVLGFLLAENVVISVIAMLFNLLLGLLQL